MKRIKTITAIFDRFAESLNKFAGGSRGDFNIIEP